LNAATLPPSADAQLAFLSKLQRLLAEGDFTATYKFGLLIALADLAVELGADDGSALVLSVRQVAERFVALYWRHAVPYSSPQGATSGVLVQNLGAQAAVINAISDFRAATGVNSFLQAQGHPSYRGLVTTVGATVSAQPLEYLQNFGGATDPFLYERGRGQVRLKEGVAYCLRRFHPLVQQLARTQWVEHIKGNHRNRTILGDGGDLEDFLFATSRQTLTLVSQELRRLDGDRCFYCSERLGEADVDHFVPFALYGRDLVNNFVLAHPSCNRSKSDTLAAKGHLERWLERLLRRSDDLRELGRHAGIAADDATARRVASWAYGNVLASGGNAWLRPSVYMPVDGDYLRILSLG
jgi:5-methylcytosine-specific restriction endonuclease McrA